MRKKKHAFRNTIRNIPVQCDESPCNNRQKVGYQNESLRSNQMPDLVNN